MIGVEALFTIIVVITPMALENGQIFFALDTDAHDRLVPLAGHRAQGAQSHLDQLFLYDLVSFSEKSDLELLVQFELQARHLGLAE